MFCLINGVGNKRLKRTLIVSVLLSFCLFQIKVDAKACTIYIDNSLLVEDELVKSENEVQANEYASFESALIESESGDVICFRDGVYNAINIHDINGGDNSITVKAAPDSDVLILSSGYTGTGVSIKNSKNIIVSGLNISGGLYGVYATGSSDLKIANNHVYDVGQEGIIVKSGISEQPLSNFIIRGNTIFRTGQSTAQYGEGIYIGDGNDDYNKIMKNIKIINNQIFNTTNEAIDIKINTTNVLIKSNTLNNINLLFNGALTVATAARFGEDSNIIIKNNKIVGVINTNGYRANGIAIGQGNAIIKDNVIIENGDKFTGICIFTTFVNEEANIVSLSGNKIITSGLEVLLDCGDGGTGVTAPANVIYF